jgi:hypothetical protein
MVKIFGPKNKKTSEQFRIPLRTRNFVTYSPQVAEYETICKHEVAMGEIRNVYRILGWKRLGQGFIT